MSIEERSLHELHTRLEQVLGPERAATLMARLSPIAWPDVATKGDLREAVETQTAMLRLEMAAQADRVRADLANQRADLANQLTAQTTTMIFSLIMVVLAIASVIVASGQ